MLLSVVRAGVWVAIDIGGTFTDTALLNDAGVVHQSKVFSTRDDPGDAVVDSLLAELNVVPGCVVEILHKTTVVSNALV